MNYPTREQREFIENNFFEVPAERASFEALTTAEELHYLAEIYNWDWGMEPLQWVVESPLCDKGTALLIYWRANPAYYTKYANSLESGNDSEGWWFIKQIEENFSTGFYSSGKIQYDPRKDSRGQDYVVSYKKEAGKWPIPAELLQPTPGTPFLLDELENKIEEVVTASCEELPISTVKELDAAYRKAVKLVEQENYSAAMPVFKRLLSVPLPSGITLEEYQANYLTYAHTALANIFLLMKEPLQAIPYYEKAALSFNSQDAFIALCELYIKLEKYEALVDLGKAFLAKYPSFKAPAMWFLAQVHISKGYALLQQPEKLATIFKLVSHTFKTKDPGKIEEYKRILATVTERHHLPAVNFA